MPDPRDTFDTFYTEMPGLFPTAELHPDMKLDHEPGAVIASGPMRRELGGAQRIRSVDTDND